MSLRLAFPNISVIGYLRWTVLRRALQDSAHSAWLSIIWVAQAYSFYAFAVVLTAC